MRTFQRIPTLVDDVLAARGGTRLVERGVGDAQAAEFFEAFDAWEAELWSTLAKVGCNWPYSLVSQLGLTGFDWGYRSMESRCPKVRLCSVVCR